MKMLSSAIVTVTTFFSHPTSKLCISDFIVKKIISDDNWNKIKNGNIRYEYFENNSDETPFGYIDFRPGVGQIGQFYIHDDRFRNRGLGKQILTKALDDIKEFGTADTIWAVTRENHPFWSNVWNKSFTWKDPAHYSVTGSGYSFKF